jgi:hypothetical protein
MAGTHTSAAQLGVMRHRIACFPAVLVKTTSALMEHSAFHTQLVTKMKLSCAAQVSRMPPPVDALVHREVAASVNLGSLALPTQHAAQMTLM